MTEYYEGVPDLATEGSYMLKPEVAIKVLEQLVEAMSDSLVTNGQNFDLRDLYALDAINMGLDALKEKHGK